MNDEEKQKRLESARQIAKSINSNDYSSNFNNIALYNIQGETEEEKEYINRFQKARDITNAINPRNNVPAHTINEETKIKSLQNGQDFINLMNTKSEDNVIQFQNNISEDQKSMLENEANKLKEASNQNVKQPSIVNKKMATSEQKAEIEKEANRLKENSVPGVQAQTNNNSNVLTDVNKSNISLATSTNLENKTDVSITDIEAMQKAKIKNENIEKGGVNKFNEVVDTVLNGFKDGFLKAPAGLANIVTTYGALAINKIKDITDLVELENTSNKLEEFYDTVIDLGSTIKEKADYQSMVNSQTKDGFTRTVGNISDVIGNIIGNHVVAFATGINGTVAQGLSVGGSSIQEVLDKNKDNIYKATLTGVAKGYVSYFTESMFDANILTKGSKTSSIQDGINKLISNKINSKFGKEFANKTVGIIGENIEELVEDNAGYLIDKLINNEDLPDFKEWLNNTSETAKITTLSTMILGLLGLGGSTFEDVEKDMETEYWIDQAQQIIDNESLAIHFNPNEVKNINNTKEFYITKFSEDGEVSKLIPTKGKEINNTNNDLNVAPVIVKDGDTGYYNIIDGNTGVVLDSTYYTTTLEAENSFNEKSNKLTELQIKDINKKINEANYLITDKIMNTITTVREQLVNEQNENIKNNNSPTDNYNEVLKLSSQIGDNEIYNNESVNSIFKFINDKVDNVHLIQQSGQSYVNSLNKDGSIAYQQKIENRNYSGSDLKKIINDTIMNADLSNIKVTQNDNSNIAISNGKQNTGTLKTNTTNYAVKDIKKVTEPFNAKNEYTRNELAKIWNGIHEKDYDALYDDNGNTKSYIAIEEDGKNLVVNQYDSEDNLVKSEIIPQNKGKYTSEAIKGTIEKVASVYDENKPIKGQVDIEGNEVKDINNNINNIISPKELSKSIERFKNAKGNIDRQDVLNIANSLNIKLKTGAILIKDTNMSRKAGHNLNPNIINITKIFENVNNKNAKEFRKNAIEEAMNKFRDSIVIIKDTKTEAEINRTGIEKTFSGKVTEEKIQTADNIKDIIEQGIYVFTSHNPNENNEILYHHFFTPVNYKENNGLVRIVIKEFTKDTTQNDKYYYHQLEYISNKKIEDFDALSHINGNKEIKSLSSIINNSIPQKTETVKIDKNTVNNSNMQNSKNNSNIQDFGEKIGGARKDLSEPRGNIKSKNKEVIHDYTVQNSENGYSVNFKGKILKDGFNTESEAEQYILNFKDTLKSNMAFVKEYNNGEKARYLVYIKNPRTLKSNYSGKEFTSKQDAENYAIALSIYLKEYGKNLYRPEIQKVERINPNNKNAMTTIGDDILNNFGFKGGEFGNWVKQSERQEFLNYAQNAFTDLAIALEIAPQSLGQNGAMNIAFGARGKGLTGAVAHFEPSKKVINMTRLKGAGSLAHEYGHSIDNYLSRISGYDNDGMATTNLRNPNLSNNMKDALNNVINNIKYSISTNQEEINKKNAIYEKNRKESLNYHLKYIDKVFNGEATTYKYNRKTKTREKIAIEVSDEQKQQYQKIRKVLEDGKVTEDYKTELKSSSSYSTVNIYPEPISTLQNLYKEIVGRKIEDDTVYGIYRNSKPTKQVTEVKSESAFSKSAKELDQATGRATAYFSKIEEMWARAFESYVSDKLKAKGITNTYLVHSVNNNEYALFNPFPAGDERKNINKAFDNLIQVMKDEGFYKSINTENVKKDDIRYMKKSRVNKTSTPKGNTLITQHNANEEQIQKELHNRIQNAIISKNSRGRTYLGNVSTPIANKVKKLFGIEVFDRRHVLADNDIRHMIKEHGNPEIEKTKGQIAITTKDIEKIPDIINNYDQIVQGNDNKDGKTIRYIKNYSDNISYVVEVMPEKGKALKIKTMWKKPVRVTNSQTTPSSTSRTEPGLSSSTSIISIPQNDNAVKSAEEENIRFAKHKSKKGDKLEKGQRNAERADAYIEQEIKKIEKTGNWDNSIPVTKLTDIRKTIENYLGLRIKKGHFRQQAYAIYKTNRDVLRTKELKDMDSILHETGHALDLGNRLKVDKESIANELLTAIGKLRWI